MATNQAIRRVEAKALRIEIDFSEYGVKGSRSMPVTYVEVETADGLVGHGMTYLADGAVVAEAVNSVARPALIGIDAMAHEKAWQAMYWTMTASAQSGYACHAISAIDLALWDIKGKAYGAPVWKLLGGARDELDIYATLGVPNLDREGLVDMAKRIVGRGFRAIKLQVGRPGLDQRAGQNSLGDILREDVRRLSAVREAVGDEVEIAMDGSCRFDLPHAVELSRRAEPIGIAWYEEPVIQNDIPLMADLRSRTAIPVSTGQNEGLAYRFRDMMVAKAVDIVQPNVSIAGGFTQCARIASLAGSFGVRMTSGGGGCPFHNMHLQAGLANGTMVEYQTTSVRASEAIFGGLPKVDGGRIRLPTGPGLGFEPMKDAVDELAMK